MCIHDKHTFEPCTQSSMTVSWIPRNETLLEPPSWIVSFTFSTSLTHPFKVEWYMSYVTVMKFVTQVEA